MKSLLYLGCPASERAETERTLAAADLAVVWAESAGQAVAELQRRELPVVLDLSRGATALQIARDLRVHRADALIFAVVDTRRPDLTTEAVLAGMADVFARPLSGRRVANAIEREQSNGSRPRPRIESSEDLYCQSPAMREVSALIARAATMRAGVIVKGEEGTGRQVVARAIHAAQRSGDGKSQFVSVDCAAHDPDELESILFGNSGRTTTDPSGRGLERISQTARVAQAHGGTLYLQNVPEAPTRVQGRLARVLRDREVHILEGDRRMPLDLRPMASVDGSIERAIQEARVRDDLYRRLSVIRIELPPLRSRREDIPALANYFVRAVCADLGVPPKTLSRPALSLLAALPWRGNAVELRGLIESVVTGLAGTRGIGIEDVLAHVRLDGGAAVYGAGGTLRQARARFEREYIGAVLEQHHGRISEAAKALGIQRTNLYRKMRALRLVRDRKARAIDR